MKNQISKLFAIGLLLALAPLSISTAFAWSDDNHHHHHPSPPPPLEGEGVNKYKYKVGDRGPGLGFIFFVDYYDQYPGFTYLEAAPTDIAGVDWCNNLSTSPGTGGWSGKGVGKGRANTIAMLEVCTSGAANEADSYLTATKSDWFLPSLGELKLMYDNLLEAGVGGFASNLRSDMACFMVDCNFSNFYWSSTEYDSGNAWYLSFLDGIQQYLTKNSTVEVRAVRAF